MSVSEGITCGEDESLLELCVNSYFALWFLFDSDEFSTFSIGLRRGISFRASELLELWENHGLPEI